MSNETLLIGLTIEDIDWAIRVARSSFAKWESQRGYYNNRLDSHFTGKLGELAVEKFLHEKNMSLDSHFRFSDRENLSDIVVKINRYKKISRVEVKTWSSHYWQSLGRCVSVEQYPVLKNKSDLVIWCVVDKIDIKEMADHPKLVMVTLAGWSSMDDIIKAPIKSTGSDGMRRIENYQLGESDLRDMRNFSESML